MHHGECAFGANQLTTINRNYEVTIQYVIGQIYGYNLECE